MHHFFQKNNVEVLGTPTFIIEPLFVTEFFSTKYHLILCVDLYFIVMIKYKENSNFTL